jgi:hypothetical protein
MCVCVFFAARYSTEEMAVSPGSRIQHTRLCACVCVRAHVCFFVFVGVCLQGTFASRMSHSCTPNCQAVVVSAGGRLTIAMHALRDIEVRDDGQHKQNLPTLHTDTSLPAYSLFPGSWPVLPTFSSRASATTWCVDVFACLHASMVMCLYVCLHVCRRVRS